MHQVQAELANAYAQEFFTVRSRDARDRLPPKRESRRALLRRPPQIPGILTDRLPFLPDRRRPCARSASRSASRSRHELSSGEQTCIARCTDRYVDATRAISNVVLQAYSQGGAGGMQ